MVESHINYDTTGDVLYISLGKARHAYVEEDEKLPGLNIRHDMQTDEIVGATIVDYSMIDKKLLRNRMPFNVELP